MRVTSTHNPLLKSVKRAASQGSPTEEGLLVAEGPHLLEEALRGFWRIETIFCSPDAVERHSALVRQSRADVVELPLETLAAIAPTQATQGILSLLRPRAWSWHDLLSAPALLVILDRIQDPGNAGTIVRSAEAFGATGIAFLKGCVRVSNTKFLRAAAGSIFRLPFLEGLEPEELIERVRGNGLGLYSLSPGASTALADVSFVGPFALVVGAEGSGLSDRMVAASTTVSIPTQRVESLNAAVASSLALFEAYKQRTTRELV